MCGRTRSGMKILKPGDIMRVNQGTRGTSSSVWGFRNGEQYNARVERINEIYRNFKTGIVTLDSFFERGVEFTHKDGKKLLAGVLLNSNNEFAVLTMDSWPLIREVHHRMPFLLNEEHAEGFLERHWDIGSILPSGLIIRKDQKLIAA